MSWDAVANKLLLDDIGLHAWEEVNIVTGGGNYGYAEREGPEQLLVTNDSNNGKTGSQTNPPTPFPSPQSVTLSPGAAQTLNFAWTPTAGGTHTLTATAAILPVEIDTADKSKTASSNVASPGATTVSVTSLTYSTPGRRLLVKVSLRNNLGSPVGGASVRITLTRAQGGSWNFTGTTSPDGTVTLRLNKAASGTYTTAVTNVTASGLTWDDNTPANSFTK